MIKIKGKNTSRVLLTGEQTKNRENTAKSQPETDLCCKKKQPNKYLGNGNSWWLWVWDLLRITQIPLEASTGATQECREEKSFRGGSLCQHQAMKSRGLLNPPFLFMYCLGKEGARVSPKSGETGTKTPRGGWEWDLAATGNPIPQGFGQKEGRKAPSEELLQRSPGAIRTGAELTIWVVLGTNQGSSAASCCSGPVQASLGTSQLLLSCSSLLILLISPFPGDLESSHLYF